MKSKPQPRQRTGRLTSPLNKGEEKGRKKKEGEIDVYVNFHDKQEELFKHWARYKIIAKGRRFGLTKGMAFYAMQKGFEDGESKILWVDTIYGNINRYYERYFLPVLAGAYLVFFCFTTINRNSDWRDPVTFFKNILNGYFKKRLVVEVRFEGRSDEAHKDFVFCHDRFLKIVQLFFVKNGVW